MRIVTYSTYKDGNGAHDTLAVEDPLRLGTPSFKTGLQKSSV